LKQEESQSASAFTAKIPAAKLTLTADAYIVTIKDRVVLTDQFSRPGGTPAGTPAAQLNALFDSANATAATFFANAIDTQSKGIAVIKAYRKWVNFKTDLSGNLISKVGAINASAILEANGQVNKYSETSRIYLEEAVPRVKANLTNSLL
jgi:iron complex outermembrane receptor protein